jgi:hypothetical protein
LRLDIPRAFYEAIFFIAVLPLGLGGMLAFFERSLALIFFFGSSTISTLIFGSFFGILLIINFFAGCSFIITGIFFYTVPGVSPSIPIGVLSFELVMSYKVSFGDSSSKRMSVSAFY